MNDQQKFFSQRKNKNLKKNDLIDSLLKKKEEPKSKIIETPKNKNGGKIIENFHKAIKLTNSDEVILKMLDLKENDILIFTGSLYGAAEVLNLN